MSATAIQNVSIFDILVRIAVATFVIGWAVVILDAISGFRLIEKVPSVISDAFGMIHNAAWVAVGVILLALFIVNLSGV
ncbi:MAG: hypothetical protein ABIS51_16600 [Sphingomonas sp.]